MPAKLILLFLTTLVTIFTNCKKETIVVAPDCQEVKAAIVANNKDEVRTVINQAIASLPSQEHTQENLNTLVGLLSGNQCMAAEILCYACIKTLPPQSEIKFTINTPGGTVYKIIDISSASIKDAKMEFINIHN